MSAITLNEITSFLGWCLVLNMGLLTLAAIFLLACKNTVIDIHHRLTGVEKSALPSLYFSYLANYKLGILLFNLVPYIALHLMG